DPVLPPRALGRKRLSKRAQRRRDSYHGENLCGGRCLGRTSLGPSLSVRLGGGKDFRISPSERRNAFRSSHSPACDRSVESSRSRIARSNSGARSRPIARSGAVKGGKDFCHLHAAQGRQPEVRVGEI